MKFMILGLPILAAAAEYGPEYGSIPLVEPLNSLCVVYTIVEEPVVISTCFSASTVATIAGCTTTIPSATCIDTTLIETKTLNGAQNAEYLTLTTDTYTTYCPEPTVFTYQGNAYTATVATTITITGM